MKATVRLGRVAGIPLAAHWSALIMPLLVAGVLGSSILPRTVKAAGPVAVWTTAAVVAVVFLACLVAHELAHAVTARRQGLTVTGITLWMLGGVTAIQDEPATPAGDLSVAVVGPLTSLLCGVASGGIAVLLATAGAADVAVAGAGWLAATNVLLAAFNMLPGAPLDGGRVLRAWVWRRTNDRRRAATVAARSGRATGLVLAGGGLLQVLITSDLVGGLWLAMIGWYLMSAAQAEQTSVEAESAFRGLPVSAAMDSRVTVLPSYQAVSAAARTAVGADVDYCPVTDFDGRIVGVVNVSKLVQAVQLPMQTTVGRIAAAVPPEAVTTSDTPLLDALRRNSGRLPILVMSERLVIGIVTPESLTHALRRGLVSMEPAA